MKENTDECESFSYETNGPARKESGTSEDH